MVEEGLTKSKKEKGDLNYKSAQHIDPTFPPLKVVTKEQLLKAYSADKVEPCKKPDTCYLNVNNKLFLNVGPFEYSENCKYLEESSNIPTVKKINHKMDSLTFSPQKLQQMLTDENVS